MIQKKRSEGAEIFFWVLVFASFCRAKPSAKSTLIKLTDLPRSSRSPSPSFQLYSQSLPFFFLFFSFLLSPRCNGLIVVLK